MISAEVNENRYLEDFHCMLEQLLLKGCREMTSEKVLSELPLICKEGNVLHSPLVGLPVGHFNGKLLPARSVSLLVLSAMVGGEEGGELYDTVISFLDEKIEVMALHCMMFWGSF